MTSVRGRGRGPASRRTRWSSLALAALMAACADGFFVDPPELPGTRVTIQTSLAAASGSSSRDGLGDAFDKADQASIVVRVPASGDVLFEGTVGFDASGGDGSVEPVEVDLGGQEGELELQLELLAQGAPLFRATARFDLSSGQDVEVVVTVEPVPSGVRVTPASLSFETLGDARQLTGAVVLATGDAWDGRPVSWTSLDPAVAVVTAQGLVTARSEGQTSVEARSGELVGRVPVTVMGTVTEVEVTPAEALVAVGQSVPFTALGFDRRGNPLVRSAQWRSTDPQVATVTPQGVATGVGPGEAFIEATMDGATGSAHLRVASEPPQVVTLLADDVTANSAVLRGQANPGGLQASGYFEWGTSPNPDRMQPTEPTDLGSGEEAVDFSAPLTGLQAGQAYYFRAVAENAAGEAHGQVISFSTDIPDLVVTGITLDPPEPNTDDAVTVTAVVANAGGAPAGASVLRFEMGSAQLTVDVPPLGPGQRAQRSWAAGALPVATHTVTVTADALGTVDEGNEQNNALDLVFSVVPAPRPDLVIAALSVDPANPLTEQPVTFRATVANQGNAPASASVAAFSLTGQAAPARIDVAPLPSGGTADVEWRVDPLAEGSYTLGVTADSEGAVQESDEQNNTRSVDFAVARTPRPDLVISSLTLDPPEPTTDDDLLFVATVANQGDAPAPASLLALTIPGVATPDPLAVNALEPGTDQVLELRLSPLPVGDYQANGQADAPNDVVESDEQNNITSLSFSVTAAPRPDLVVVEVKTDPVEPTTEQPVTVTVTVANTGNAPAGAFDVLTELPELERADLQTVDGLPAGQSAQLVWEVGILGEGTFQLRSTADAGGVVDESDENNNTLDRTLGVGLPPRADLVVESIAFDPTELTSEAPFTVTVTVRNQGTAAATPTDLDVSVPQAELFARLPVGVIAVGGAQSVQWAIGPLAAGSYSLDALANSTNTAVESDTSNNAASQPFTVTDPPRADLAAGLTVLTTQPDAADPVTVRVRVDNLGNLASPQTSAELRLVGGGSPLQTVLIDPLQPGGFVESDLLVGPFAAGTVTLEWVVDPANQVEETDENNNLASASVVVAPLNTISGVVTVEGAPQAGLTVQASDPDADTETTVTGADGSYVIANLSDGNYALAVTDGPNDVSFPPLNVPVSGGVSVTADLAGTYVRTASISGTVSLSGVPLGGVQVALDGPDGQQVTSTDEAGFYGFSGLRQGDHTVSITPPAGWNSPVSQGVFLNVGQAVVLDFSSTSSPFLTSISWAISGPLNGCTVGQGEVTGTSNSITFGFTDDDGDVPSPAQVLIELFWSDGTVGNPIDATWDRTTGDGSSGTFVLGLCTFWSATDWVDYQVTLFDGAGNPSNPLTVRADRPEGANAPPAGASSAGSGDRARQAPQASPLPANRAGGR